MTPQEKLTSVLYMQELGGTGGLGTRDVFDYPEAEPTELFINPFACAIDPFMWNELQVRLCCGLLACPSGTEESVLLSHVCELLQDHEGGLSEQYTEWQGLKRAQQSQRQDTSCRR